MITSAEEFVELRQSSNRSEYLRAAHDLASLDVWFEIVDRFPSMRVWVAHNKTVPIEILERLVGDPDPAVRRMVATKGTATPQILESLARDTDDTVRMGVVRNRKTSHDVLRQLASDRWGEVARIATQRLME